MKINKFKEFEAIRWYTSGALLPPEEDSESNDSNIEIGDEVILKNRELAYYDISNRKFRFSEKSDIRLGKVRSFKEFDGILCAKIYNGNFYRVECIEKVINDI